MSTDRILKVNEWQDLVKYKPWEVIKEISLPIPWFVVEIWAATNQHYGLMLFAAAYFFLTCLRVSHNAFHYCLGLSRTATDGVMLLLSVFMMTSMRATQYTHMQHHSHCLKENDVEGYIAKLGFWSMLLQAPLFTIKLHKEALSRSAKGNSKQSQKQNLWIKFEIALNVIWMCVVWIWLDVDALKIHAVLMMLSHVVSPMFTVWSVHHDCEDGDDTNHTKYNSRTLRSSWMSLVAYNMFFHLEHHSYPAIPTCHLPALAERLDRAGLKNYKTVL